MQIRKMQHSDLEYVVDIEKQCLDGSWSQDDFIYELESNPFSQNYVIIDGEVIGFLCLWMIDGQCQIANIAIHKTYQKQGYGNALMHFCMEQAHKEQCSNINLEVRVSNIPAISLYKKYGLKEVALRKRYYKNGEDAYLMMKEMEE